MCKTSVHCTEKGVFAEVRTLSCCDLLSKGKTERKKKSDVIIMILLPHILASFMTSLILTYIIIMILLSHIPASFMTSLTRPVGHKMAPLMVVFS